MLNAVRNFLSEITKPAEREEGGLADDRLAAAALLVHISGVDGDFSADEHDKLRDLLTERFSLDQDDADKLIARAEKADHEAVDLFSFTSVLKAKLDEAGRARIVGMMWDMVFADGEVHEFEDNLVWRVAELLGVSSRDRVRLKQEARRHIQAG